MMLCVESLTLRFELIEDKRLLFYKIPNNILSNLKLSHYIYYLKQYRADTTHHLLCMYSNLIYLGKNFVTVILRYELALYKGHEALLMKGITFQICSRLIESKLWRAVIFVSKQPLNHRPQRPFDNAIQPARIY